jgi:hypothetical protein
MAEACGGIIASNIPEYSDFEEFSNKRIGLWGRGIFKYRVWATAEHIFFWSGALWVGLQYLSDTFHEMVLSCNCGFCS